MIGAEPKKPLKNRVSKTVWMSFAVAVPKDMTVAMRNGTNTGHFLPYTSESGAHRRGPNVHLCWRHQLLFVCDGEIFQGDWKKSSLKRRALSEDAP